MRVYLHGDCVPLHVSGFESRFGQKYLYLQRYKKDQKVPTSVLFCYYVTHFLTFRIDEPIKNLAKANHFANIKGPLRLLTCDFPMKIFEKDAFTHISLF